MVKEVRWTAEAVSSFQKVFDYLETNWTEREVINFINSTNRITNFICSHPKMFRATNRTNIREALVTPHNLLIYKIQKNSIDLITFWDVRQHPRKKKKKF